jgi:DNA-binding HxlR family transcriptional regulator
MDALVAVRLGDGNERFSEPRRSREGSTECSRSFSRGLERDGLVTRTAYSAIPTARRVRIGSAQL